MAREAASQDLLYVSDEAASDVYVYSYPRGKLQGTLTGFNGPTGECADKTGDVFIANYDAANILEYAHGGTSRVATLKDAGYYPSSCSIDPTTGNLAVANEYATNSGHGNVVIYQGAKGVKKTHYYDPNIFYYFFCGYDNKGNLFVDGTPSTGPFVLAELPHGGASFKDISLNQSIAFPGAIQWDGTHLAVGDHANMIYQFSISRRKGTEAGSTSLMGASDVGEFWIEGSKVIGADAGGPDVGYWNYPAGGSPTKTIKGALKEPRGVTVSNAK